jgi:hypothetical protein
MRINAICNHQPGASPVSVDWRPLGINVSFVQLLVVSTTGIVILIMVIVVLRQLI